MRVLIPVLVLMLAMTAWQDARADGARIQGLPCVTQDVEGNGSYNPVVVLANSCDTVVFWRVCVNYPMQLEREYYEGSLQPGEAARIETYPAEGEEFWFGGWAMINSDMVPEPEC